MAEDRQTRRYPHNLQGVLQLAVDAGSAGEGPAPLEPMTEEVMSSMASISEFKKIILLRRKTQYFIFYPDT